MSIDLSPETVRILLALGAIVIAHFIARNAFHHAERVASRTNNVWDDAFISAARVPLLILIWFVGISFILHLLHRQTGELLLEYLPAVRNIGVIACVAWFLLRFIRAAADNVVTKLAQDGEEVDHTTIDVLSKVSRITIIVFATLGVLQSLGFSLSGLLAFGGMGGIAVGFAAKDLLSNLFGGLMIHLDRPFKLNDFIRMPDQNLGGTVEYIGWRHTRLRSVERTALYVPNSLFTTIVVENVTRMTHRRLDLTIGLRYEDMGRVEAVSSDIRAQLDAHPDIDHDLVVAIGLDEFADSSLNLKVMAFTTATDFIAFRALKQHLLLQIATILAKHGADMPFPTRTLHVVNDGREA